jgi:hypothetical protein
MFDLHQHSFRWRSHRQDVGELVGRCGLEVLDSAAQVVTVMLGTTTRGKCSERHTMMVHLNATDVNNLLYDEEGVQLSSRGGMGQCV